MSDNEEKEEGFPGDGRRGSTYSPGQYTRYKPQEINEIIDCIKEGLHKKEDIVAARELVRRVSYAAKQGPRPLGGIAQKLRVMAADNAYSEYAESLKMLARSCDNCAREEQKEEERIRNKYENATVEEPVVSAPSAEDKGEKKKESDDELVKFVTYCAQNKISRAIEVMNLISDSMRDAWTWNVIADKASELYESGKTAPLAGGFCAMANALRRAYDKNFKVKQQQKKTSSFNNNEKDTEPLNYKVGGKEKKTSRNPLFYEIRNMLIELRKINYISVETCEEATLRALDNPESFDIFEFPRLILEYHANKATLFAGQIRTKKY